MYNYKELKKKKSVKIKKDGKQFFLTINRFDYNTGEKKEPLVIMLHKDRLEKHKTEHEKEATDSAEILKDMKLLEGRKK